MSKRTRSRQDSVGRARREKGLATDTLTARVATGPRRRRKTVMAPMMAAAMKPTAVANVVNEGDQRFEFRHGSELLREQT